MLVAVLALTDFFPTKYGPEKCFSGYLTGMSLM